MAMTKRTGTTISEDHGTDKRSADRQKLILRVGLLEHNGRSIFCLVKNISASGVQVKPYGDLPPGVVVSLRVGDETPIGGTLVWSRGGLVGVKFAQALNPQTLLRIGQKMVVHKRRTAPRLVIELKGFVRTGGTRQPITICDLSVAGARVQTDRPFKFGETTIIDLPGFPSLNACVRWSDAAEFGVSFHPPLPMQIVAELLSEDRPPASRVGGRGSKESREQRDNGGFVNLV